MRFLSLRLVRFSVAVAIAVAPLAVPSLVGAARADISSVDLFRNSDFLQTANGNSLTLQGYFFSARLFSSGSNDFTGAQLTYPGAGSPVSMTAISPTTFLYQTGFLPTQAAMDTSFPTGTYTFNASGSTPDSTSVIYASDAYPQSVPYLTGSDYSNLQGMNASSAFTFHLSPFTTGNQASSSFIFFTISDVSTNAVVFSDSFLSPTTSSLTVPAGTLQSSHSYVYELDFSNRNSVSSPGADSPATLGYDIRTDGNFTTAAAIVVTAPEPGSLALLLPGALTLMGLIAHRRRAQ